MQGNSRLRRVRTAAAAALAMLALTAAPAFAGQEVAETLIQRSDAIIAQLAELRQNDALDNDAALHLIQMEMSPLFDFERLTKRAMGKYWRRTEPPTREAIVAAFRELLERTYAKVLAQYSGQQVELLSVAGLPDDELSVVLTVSDGSKSAEVEYVYAPADAGYLIGDIKVEGISLVANYRRQFASVIRQDGAEALVDKLHELAAAKF